MAFYPPKNKKKLIMGSRVQSNIQLSGGKIPSYCVLRCPIQCPPPPTPHIFYPTFIRPWSVRRKLLRVLRDLEKPLTHTLFILFPPPPDFPSLPAIRCPLLQQTPPPSSHPRSLSLPQSSRVQNNAQCIFLPLITPVQIRKKKGGDRSLSLHCWKTNTKKTPHRRNGGWAPSLRGLRQRNPSPCHTQTHHHHHPTHSIPTLPHKALQTGVAKVWRVVEGGSPHTPPNHYFFFFLCPPLPFFSLPTLLSSPTPKPPHPQKCCSFFPSILFEPIQQLLSLCLLLIFFSLSLSSPVHSPHTHTHAMPALLE